MAMHPQWGEAVCAVVVRRAGGPSDLDEMRRHCDGRLARFKHPRRFVEHRTDALEVDRIDGPTIAVHQVPDRLAVRG